jgi:hypothetical protein
VGTRGRTVRVVSERHTTTKTASQNCQEIVCGTHEAMRSKARLLLRGTGLPKYPGKYRAYYSHYWA